MIIWVFQVSVTHLEVLDLQLPEGILREGSRIDCRMTFDGKTVSLLPNTERKSGVEKVYSSFKYRIRSSSLIDLVATLSQRVALFQVIISEVNDSQTNGDIVRTGETVAGITMVDILRLAQNGGAQYQLALMRPDTTCGEKVGVLSSCIFMEQVGDVELQLKKLRVSGVGSGEYRLHCSLSSGLVDMKSEVTRSVLGAALWTRPIILKPKFHGTLQALETKKLELTLLKVQRNGVEALVSSSSVKLNNVGLDTAESVREIPFDLESETTFTSFSGVLRLVDLPIFSQRVRQLSENRVLRYESNGKEESRASPSSCMTSPQKGESSTSVLWSPHTPPSASPLVSNGRRVKAYASPDSALPPQSAKQDSESPVLAHNSIRSCDHGENTDRYVLDASPKSALHVASLHGEGLKDDVSSASWNAQSCGVTTEQNQHSIFSQLCDADVVAVNSTQSLCAAEVAEAGKERKMTFENGNNGQCDDGKVKGEDTVFVQQEQEIHQALACIDWRIATLLEFLKNADVSPEFSNRVFSDQIQTLELRFSELCDAEEVLLKLGESIVQRLRVCADTYHESELEFSASKARIDAYTTILLDVDRQVCAKYNCDGNAYL